MLIKKIWDIESATCLQKLNIGHTGISYSIAKISNEKKASGDRNDKIIIWKIGNGEILKIIDAHSDYIWSLVKLSKNKIISCSGDKIMKVWDTESGFCLNTLEYHAEKINCIDTF